MNDKANQNKMFFLEEFISLKQQNSNIIPQTDLQSGPMFHESFNGWFCWSRLSKISRFTKKIILPQNNSERLD